MAVGDNQGNTYTGREGVDKAFILPESRQHLNDAAKTIDFYVQQDLFKKQQAQKQKQADKAALNKAFEIEEPWYVFNDEIEREAAKVFQFAQDLNAAGINPMTDPSKEANQFRMELNRVTNAAKYSKQIQKPYEQTLATYNKNPDKFTQDSKNTVYNFPKNKSIFDMAKLGETVPTLEYKMPLVDLNPDIQGIAKSLEPNSTNSEILTVGNAFMGDDPQREAQIEQVVNNMSPAEKARLQQYQMKLGKELGGEPPSLNQAYTHRWIKDYMKDPKPFDQEGFLKGIPSTFIKSSYSYEDDAGVTRKGTTTMGDEKAYKKTTLERLQVGVNNDPQMANWYQSHLGMEYQPMKRNKKGELVPSGDPKTINSIDDFAGYLANQKFVADKYERGTGTNRKFFSDLVKKSGRGRDEIEQNYDQWWRALHGEFADQNPDLQREAASYLGGVLMAQGFTISENQPEIITIGLDDDIKNISGTLGRDIGLPSLVEQMGIDAPDVLTIKDLGGQEPMQIMRLEGVNKDGDYQTQYFILNGPNQILDNPSINAVVMDREQGMEYWNKAFKHRNYRFFNERTDNPTGTSYVEKTAAQDPTGKLMNFNTRK